MEFHSKTECYSRETQGRVGGKTKMLPVRGPRVADRAPGSPRTPATALSKSLEKYLKIVSIRSGSQPCLNFCGFHHVNFRAVVSGFNFLRTSALSRILANPFLPSREWLLAPNFYSLLSAIYTCVRGGRSLVVKTLDLRLFFFTLILMLNLY